jgi:NAD+ diphosphatase
MTVSASSGSSRGRIAPLVRGAAERLDDDLVVRLRTAPDTLVLAVRGDAAPLDEDGLRAVAVADVPDDAEWAFLGRSSGGHGVLLASVDPDAPDDVVPAPDGWGSLRAVGGMLPAEDFAVLVTGVALGRWLRDAAFCPACGARARLRSAGWSRVCPACGREHFPRTDPAVIVAVTRDDDPDALLLGSNAAWGPDRYSCFAGFAEAGESLEDALVREVQEEAGVQVGDLRYVSSQGWPYPRSLMLGFRAVARDAALARPDGEEILSVRWFTRAEIGAGLEGTSSLKLPGPASIAHRLIRDWHAERP